MQGLIHHETTETAHLLECMCVAGSGVMHDRVRAVSLQMLALSSPWLHCIERNPLQAPPLACTENQMLLH